MHRLFLKIVRIIYLSNLTVLLLCVNCSQSGQKTELEGGRIPTIDIIGNIPKVQKVNLSTIASSIEYCMLETNEKCLLRDKNIYSSGDYFVYMSINMSWKECFIFERKTGKFVRQIGRIGQGPDDYQSTVRVLESDNGQICLEGNNRYLFYNLDGTLSHKTNHFANIFMAFDDFYVRYVHNTRGNSTIRIAFYDRKTGELSDSIPNYRHYVRTIPSYQTSIDFSFHIFDNNLYYKDIYCDTLYKIKDFTLQPQYFFNTGGRTVPYESQNEGKIDVQAVMAGRENDRWAKYIVINGFFEATNYLFFTFDYRNRKYPAIFNKSEDKLFIIPSVSIPFFFFRDNIIPLFGLENDLDGGLPFWPQQMISDNEMMCVYTVEELMEIDESKITDPKLKNVLNSLEFDSNPVVAIVTLK